MCKRETKKEKEWRERRWRGERKREGEISFAEKVGGRGGKGVVHSGKK